MSTDYEQGEEAMAAYVARANAEFAHRWPRHCRACGGWGGSTYVEMHGFRHGTGEQIFDPCGAIEDPHICHRCGSPGLDEDGNGPCITCGWDYDDGLL